MLSNINGNPLKYNITKERDPNFERLDPDPQHWANDVTSLCLASSSTDFSLHVNEDKKQGSLNALHKGQYFLKTYSIAKNLNAYIFSESIILDDF